LTPFRAIPCGNGYNVGMDVCEWKDTLEDLGVVGLVPDPPPPPPAPPPPLVLPGASVSAAPSFSAPAPPRPIVPPKAAAPPKPQAAEWEPPSDPAKNPPQPAIDGCTDLEGLNAIICRCEACPLGMGRVKFVFGEGSPNARLMFVGEGPGRDEDIQGRPFVGRAGALLDKMIGALGLARGDVYIANIVKCRPPDNRVPTPAEAKACARYLEKQVALVKPAALVGLGATPLRDLVGGAEKITKVRGAWHKVKAAGREIPFMPTFHPAYVLRNYTHEVRAAVWEDLKEAKRLADASG